MGKKALQCLFIGKPLKIYKDISNSLAEFNLNLQVRCVDAEKSSIIKALKKQRVASLIFISDEVSFSLEYLSDIVWQYSADSIVTIITLKSASSYLNRPFNSTQFSQFNYDKNSNESKVYLRYLIQTAQLKWEFRHCKRLLGVSEKRSQWLVDSSNQAVAFILRDLHLYANTAYLGLLDIDSIHELPSIPLQAIIVDDEYALFKDFVNKQMRNHEINRSIIVSLRKQNGKVFRANIRVIPSVFKGRKCLQLWVHPLSLHELKDEQELKQQSDNIVMNTRNSRVLSNNKQTPSSILQGIIKRKEAKISAQRLVAMQTKRKDLDSVYLMLSLKVPVAQRTGIENILADLSSEKLEEKRQIFWDKVKLTRLLQILLKKKTLSMNLFISIDEASITDTFMDWLLPGLKKIASKSSSLVVLLPSQVDSSHMQSYMRFTSQLRSFDCQIALDNFSVSKESISLLKHLRPDYVRLSLPWVRQIEGNDSQELALGSFIRQLEAKDIRVVAPCGFSKDMRKLFALSGVSFCQERRLKNAQ